MPGLFLERRTRTNKVSEPPRAHFFHADEGPNLRLVVAGLAFWPFSASTSLNSCNRVSWAERCDADKARGTGTYRGRSSRGRCGGVHDL